MMSLLKNPLADFINGDEPIVVFKFPDGSSLRIVKRILVDKSDVFKTMLDGGKWAEGSKMEILVEEPAFINLRPESIVKAYQILISALCGSPINCFYSDAINVYAIAHKYQIEEIKKSTIVELQNGIDRGVIMFKSFLRNLLKFISTYHITNLNLAQIERSLVDCASFGYSMTIYDVANKYQSDEIKGYAVKTLQREVHAHKVHDYYDFLRFLKFQNTHKIPGLDNFKLDITKGNFCDFFTLNKTFKNSNARLQLARFVIDNEITYHTLPGELAEMVFTSFKEILREILKC